MSALVRANRLMDPFGLDAIFGQMTEGGHLGGYRPFPVDVRETVEGFVVEAELPGFTKEQLDITLENGMLTLSAERKVEEEAQKEGEGYHLRERRYSKFERSFKLPQTIDESSVDAKLENGVLTVKIAKRPETKPRKITVG